MNDQSLQLPSLPGHSDPVSARAVAACAAVATATTSPGVACDPAARVAADTRHSDPVSARAVAACAALNTTTANVDVARVATARVAADTRHSDPGHTRSARAGAAPVAAAATTAGLAAVPAGLRRDRTWR
jgi:hypothetical protein